MAGSPGSIGCPHRQQGSNVMLLCIPCLSFLIYRGVPGRFDDARSRRPHRRSPGHRGCGAGPTPSPGDGQGRVPFLMTGSPGHPNFAGWNFTMTGRFGPRRITQALRGLLRCAVRLRSPEERSTSQRITSPASVLNSALRADGRYPMISPLWMRSPQVSRLLVTVFPFTEHCPPDRNAGRAVRLAGKPRRGSRRLDVSSTRGPTVSGRRASETSWCGLFTAVGVRQRCRLSRRRRGRGPPR